MSPAAAPALKARLDDLLARFNPDPDWLRRAAAFQHALFRGQPPAELMISLPGQAVAGHENEVYNLEEQWRDPHKMLYEHLRLMTSMALTGQGAAVPRLRANLGVGFVPSVFGIEQLLFPDKMPWPRTHLSKQQISDADPAAWTDLHDRGLMPYARRIYDVYRQELGTHAYSYVPDTQGVLDIAHLVRGDELFTDFYEDPPFVHHLLELSLQVYIAATKDMKSALGEPSDSGNHAGLAMVNGGVRYCMDISVLCSREMLAEFELPYLRRALAEFGGGWIHFCGYAPQVTDLLVEVPEVRGVNPNYMDSRPYDYVADIAKLSRAGKFFFGAPFKSAAQSLPDYFDMLLAPLPTPAGVYFQPRGEGLGGITASQMQAEWDAALERRWP